MRSAALSLALGLALAPALAAGEEIEVTDVGFTVDIPAGFAQRRELAEPVVHSFHDPARMDALPYRAGGLVFANADSSAVIYALWRVTDQEPSDTPHLVRAELDELHRLAGAHRRVASTEKVQAKVALARVEYQAVDETRTLAQAALFIDAKGRVHEVHVECVMAEDQLAKVRPACEHAVVFAVSLPEEQRRPLGTIAPPTRRLGSTPAPAQDAGGPAPSPVIGPIVVAPGPPSALGRILTWGGIALVIIALGVTLAAARRRRS